MKTVPIVLPPGLRVKRVLGGYDEFRNILTDLSNYSFTGYLRISKPAKNAADGVIVLHEGRIINAILVKSNQLVSFSDSAIIDIASELKSSRFEIHVIGRVDVAAISRTIFGAMKSGLQVVLEFGAKDKVSDEEGFLLAEVQILLKDIIKRNPPAKIQRDAKKIEELSREPYKASVALKMAIELDRELNELDKADEQKKEARKDSGAKGMPPAMQSDDEKKRADKVESVINLILASTSGKTTHLREDDIGPTCPKCNSKLGKDQKCTICGDKEFIAPKGFDIFKYTKRVDPSQTFESFVTDKNNRFAYAAMFAVASSPVTTYNPLMIVGVQGVGRTHLLGAAANFISGKKELKTLFIQSDRVARDSRRHSGNDVFSELTRNKSIFDVIIIDDMHHLLPVPKLQESLAIFIKFCIENKKQIIIGSNRNMHDEYKMSDQLMSSMSRGLTVDLLEPEKKSRIEILTRRATETGIEGSGEIIRYIANNIEGSLREMEMALSKVIAFGNLMKVDVNLGLAKEVLKEQVKRGGDTQSASDISIKEGVSYLLEEERPDALMMILKRLEAKGIEGLYITRTNPKRMDKKYKFKHIRLLWLTDKEGDDADSIPPILERLNHRFEKYVHSMDRVSIIALDGLEYLIDSNNFDAVVKFLRRSIDDISDSRMSFLISVSPKALKEKEIKILEREMEALYF